MTEDKGDAGRGLFVQFTVDTPGEADVPIPDEAGSSESAISFGVLKLAQASGDGQALRDSGRGVIRFHFGAPDDVADGIKALAEELA